MKELSDRWLIKQAKKLNLAYCLINLSNGNHNKPRTVLCNSCFFQSVCKLDYVDECIGYKSVMDEKQFEKPKPSYREELMRK